MDFSTEKLLHGGDYNPEQWLDKPEILEQDISFFLDAKINCVTLGVFSWSTLEPEEGVYNFKWLEDIINRLYENGIYTILSTPSGARPKWLADKYPEVLRIEADGQRNFFGGRHNHCYSSPVYRQKTAQIDKELAKRFGNHPAVILWHISNEFGGECFCNYCQNEFRSWLKKRYKTIEELNSRWYTTFWSHTYNSFDAIEAPSPRGESSLFALNLDWKRFVTDRTVDFAAHEKAALREGGSELPVTINMMYHFGGLNYHCFKDVIDVVSWDNYPTWHKGPESLTALDTGMYHDIMRTIKRKPFLLMESCPSSTNWQSVSKLKRPGMLEAASLQAVAHGSDSVCYFQLRQSRGTVEKLHGAVIDHYGGKDTRVFKEICTIGDSLVSLKEVCGSDIKAQAAVLYDWENRWAVEAKGGPRNKELYLKEAALKPYSALRKLGYNVDLTDMEQSIDRYRLVIAPMMYMFRDGFEEKVRKFVENGGVFVITYWSGVADETDLCFLGARPHGLTDVLGLRSTEIDGLYDGEYNELEPSEGAEYTMKNTYRCEYLCELVKTDTAKPIMTYKHDFYKGMPVVTVNSYKAGKAFYVGADSEQAFWDEFAGILANAADMKPILNNIPEGVEVTKREDSKYEYIFVQNYNTVPAEINISTPGRKKELLYKSSECEFDCDKDCAKLSVFGTLVWKSPLV